MKTDSWPKNERIDWILFRAQLENVAFGDRVLKFEITNPQVYTEECTNAIFSLLKKEYDTPRKRALAATARLKQMPALLKQGLTNLQKPVKLYAQLAIQSARSIDPLLNKSLMVLDVDLSPNERNELLKARDSALTALHADEKAREHGLKPQGDERCSGNDQAHRAGVIQVPETRQPPLPDGSQQENATDEHRQRCHD